MQVYPHLGLTESNQLVRRSSGGLPESPGDGIEYRRLARTVAARQAGDVNRTPIKKGIGVTNEVVQLDRVEYQFVVWLVAINPVICDRFYLLIRSTGAKSSI